MRRLVFFALLVSVNVASIATAAPYKVYDLGRHYTIRAVNNQQHVLGTDEFHVALWTKEARWTVVNSVSEYIEIVQLNDEDNVLTVTDGLIYLTVNGSTTSISPPLKDSYSDYASLGTGTHFSLYQANNDDGGVVALYDGSQLLNSTTLASDQYISSLTTLSSGDALIQLYDGGALRLGPSGPPSAIPNVLPNNSKVLRALSNDRVLVAGPFPDRGVSILNSDGTSTTVFPKFGVHTELLNATSSGLALVNYFSSAGPYVSENEYLTAPSILRAAARPKSLYCAFPASSHVEFHKLDVNLYTDNYPMNENGAFVGRNGRHNALYVSTDQQLRNYCAKEEVNFSPSCSIDDGRQHTCEVDVALRTPSGKPLPGAAVHILDRNAGDPSDGDAQPFFPGPVSVVSEGRSNTEGKAQLSFAIGKGSRAYEVIGPVRHHKFRLVGQGLITYYGCNLPTPDPLCQ